MVSNSELIRRENSWVDAELVLDGMDDYQLVEKYSYLLGDDDWHNYRDAAGLLRTDLRVDVINEIEDNAEL